MHSSMYRIIVSYGRRYRRVPLANSFSHRHSHREFSDACIYNSATNRYSETLGWDHEHFAKMKNRGRTRAEEGGWEITHEEGRKTSHRLAWQYSSMLQIDKSTQIYLCTRKIAIIERRILSFRIFSFLRLLYLLIFFNCNSAFEVGRGEFIS